LSWIARFTARTGSLVAALTLMGALAAPARADGPPVYLFGGKAIVMSQTVSQAGGLAVGVDDPGLREILRDVGAALTYNPGDRYVLVTTAEPQVISFAIGDTRYDVGSTSSQAAFAPFDRGGVAYVPFDELLRALDLAVKREGADSIIQPQLAVVDVQSADGRTTVVARAGVPLHARLVSETPQRLVFAFEGVGTTLQRTRSVRAAGVAQLEIVQSGDARYPVTTVTVDLTPGASHGVADSDDGRDFTIGFTGPQSGGTVAIAQPEASWSPPPAPAQLPAQEPTELPASAPGSAPATVGAIAVQPGPDGLTIDVTVTGDASYEWHRLRDPDNRFWIDVHDATLAMPPRDEQETGPVSALRIRQIDASTVRLALSLAGPQRLDVNPTATGVRIVVHADTVSDDVARAGAGNVGAAAIAAALNPDASPAPIDSGNGAWKFGPHDTYVAANPRMIAIDPGHGGSDPGVVKGSTHEAALALDISVRLRDILIARGWQVVMTRTADVDVISPYDSARVELQGRDDIAYNAGARLLVSVHVNGYLNSGPHGTTTYYSKPADLPLAHAIERRAGAELGIKDDGIVKNDLYVTLHAQMPAILIETAFLTNPGDNALLTSAAWRQKVAQAIADGIGDYAGTAPPAAQSGNQ
jgi:N-acetylmuramoyl-L-alanine amidase